MALVTGRSFFSVVARWLYSKSDAVFGAASQIGTLSFPGEPAAGTYQHAFQATYTINAAGTQAVDFRGPWTSAAAESVTGAKILGYIVIATGNSTLTIEPHGTHPLTWPMGADGVITITPSTGQGVSAHCDGTHATLSGTVKQWLLTNTGGATLTVSVMAFIGT